jgi:fibronectin-binding autotransporter adhesin
MRFTISRLLARSSLRLLVALTLAVPFARAQLTLTYSSGETRATAYDTTAPNSPLTLDLATGAATQSGVLSGSGNLVKSGAGNLTLSATNTYSGATAISAGTLTISSLAALGGSSGAISIATGGTLTGGASNLSFNRAVTIDGPGSALATTGYFEFGNSDTGSLAITNGGALSATASVGFGVAFANASTGTGSVTGTGSTLTTGTLILAAFGGTGTFSVGSGGIVTASLVRFGVGGAGAGTLNLNSGGTLRLGGTDALLVAGGTGVFNLAGGTLRVTGSALTSAVPATLVATTTSTIDTNGLAATLSGVLSGPGALTKTGLGTLTLSAANTYTGATTINAGTLQSTAAFAADSAVVVTGPTARFNAGSAGALAVLDIGFNGTGSLAITDGAIVTGSWFTRLGVNAAGVGTATVTGAGSQLIANGSLELGAFGNGTLTVAGGGTVTASSSAGLTFGSIGGTGTLNLNPGGTLQVGRTNGIANAGTATFNLAGGTLQVISVALTTSVPATLVTATTSTFDTNGFAATLSGVLSGAGTLLKSGAGPLTLSAANTYAGGTTVSAGYVNFNTVASFGTGTVTLDGGGLQWATGTTTDISPRLAALGAGGTTFDTNGNQVTLATALTGSGPLTKTGVGTLTLSGTNTYAGGTTISAGLVNFSSLANLGTGTVTLDGGGLQWATGNTLDLSASAQLNRTLGAGGTTFDTNGNNITLASALSGAGALAKTGTGTLTFSADNTYTGPTTLSAGTLALGTGGTTGSLTGDILNNAALPFNRSDAFTFTGAITGTGTLTKTGAGTLSLSGANTYAGGTTLSNGTLQIGAGGATGSLSGPLTLATGTALVFNRTGVLIYDGAISGAGSVTQSGPGATTVTGALTHTGGTVVSAGSLSIGASGTTGTLTGDILNNASLLFNRSDASTYAGTISGTGSVAKAGTGTLTLTGANTYSGPTILTAGILRISSAAALGDGSATNTLVFGLGTLQAAAPLTLPGTRAITLTNNGTIDTNGQSVTLAGPISGNGAITKTGAGTLTLFGTNTYTGATVISTGTLLLGAANALPAATDILFQSGTGGTLDLAGFSPTVRSLQTNGLYPALVTLGNGTLTINTATLSTFSGIISGTGGLVKTGSGTQSLRNENTYTGLTTISAGTLRLQDGSAGRGSVAGNILNNAALTFRLFGFDTIYAGDISGTGTLLKEGPRTQVFTGANTYTGATTISVGTLQIGAGGTAGSLTSDIINSAALAFNRSDASTYAGIISGTGALTKSGAGTLTLTGTHTYTGATFVNAGTLLVNGSLAATALTVASTATLGGSGTLGGLATLSSGAILAPGNSPGTITFSQGLTLNTGSILNFELGTTSDLIRVTGGTLTGPGTPGGVTLNLSDSGGFSAGNYTLINYATATGTTQFGADSFALGTTIPGYTYTFALAGNALQLTATASAIPEPSTYAALAGLAALALAAHRKRHRT